MSFRDHIWAASLHGILAASLALLVPGIPPRDRRVLLALASMPIVLSLDMGKLQARANPCNTGIISRNEMRKAVRVRSSAL